jgi:hypothetical protein
MTDFKNRYVIIGSSIYDNHEDKPVTPKEMLQLYYGTRTAYVASETRYRNLAAALEKAGLRI